MSGADARGEGSISLVEDVTLPRLLLTEYRDAAATPADVSIAPPKAGRGTECARPELSRGACAAPRHGIVTRMDGDARARDDNTSDRPSGSRRNAPRRSQSAWTRQAGAVRSASGNEARRGSTRHGLNP
jgi:hypothetical protein